MSHIHDHFSCKCSGGPFEHFPKIVNYNEESLSINMSNLGSSLNKPGVREQVLAHLQPKDIFMQVQCIVDNLERANVKHLDCPKNGQNICWDGRSLSLIDFDACLVNNLTFPNRVIRKWNSNYGNWKEYRASYIFQLMYAILGPNEASRKVILTTLRNSSSVAR